MSLLRYPSHTYYIHTHMALVSRRKISKLKSSNYFIIAFVQGKLRGKKKYPQKTHKNKLRPSSRMSWSVEWVATAGQKNEVINLD